MSKIISASINLLFYLFFINPFFPLISNVYAADNCKITVLPQTLIENTAPILTSAPESERWIRFEIKPTDTAAKYRLVFPKGLGSVWTYRDNLTARNSDGALVDDKDLPGLQFTNTTDMYFKTDEIHTFYLEKKGVDGKYCEGTYLIKADRSGGIQNCNLNFTPNPNEKTDITVSGTIKPVNNYYQIRISGHNSKEVAFKNDGEGIIPLTTIGKLLPGENIATLQTLDIISMEKLEKTIYKDTNCVYKIDVAQGDGQGSVFQIGTAGPNGTIITPQQDICIKEPYKCSKAGGITCPNGFVTALGCIRTQPKLIVEDVLKLATGIGGGLAFMMMLLGAFQMLTSGGNPQNLQGGRDVFQNAIIGLLFIIFSILLMKIIGIDILSIPGFASSP